MRIYLDSNVLIAYLRSEIDGAFNLRYLDSEKFFILCGALGIEIVISDTFLKEIFGVVNLPHDTVRGFFEMWRVSTVPAAVAEMQDSIDTARKTGIHFADAVHIATAVKERCDYIVTWNLKDFEKAKALMPCKSPREFIDAFG